MANVDNPHGLRPLMRAFGGGCAGIEQLSKVAGYGTALFIGDAVNRVADGSIEASATPGTTLYSGVNLNYAAASKASDHLVITDPDMIFEAQDNDAGGTGFVAADMGLNANLQLNSGSATTQISGHEINTTGAAVTASLDVHLMRKLDVPDNAFGPSCRVEIMFNKHRMAKAAVGV